MLFRSPLLLSHSCEVVSTDNYGGIIAGVDCDNVSVNIRNPYGMLSTACLISICVHDLIKSTPFLGSALTSCNWDINLP